jgi:hypothetical protein
MFLHARTIWTHLEQNNQAPSNYKTAGIKILNEFRGEMEKTFIELQLCSNHWKVDRIWINNYPSWLEHINKNKDPSRSKKRKAQSQEPINISSSDDEDDGLVNISQPGKKKQKGPQVKSPIIISDSPDQDQTSLPRPKPRKRQVRFIPFTLHTVQLTDRPYLANPIGYGSC